MRLSAVLSTVTIGSLSLLIQLGFIPTDKSFAEQPGSASVIDANTDAPDASDGKPEDDLEAILDLDIGELQTVNFKSTSPLGGRSSADIRDEARRQAADSGSANIIGGDEASARNTTDVGSLLGRSNYNPGVSIQQRNPIISDPRIRGLRFGQYLARSDGAYWFPSRLDLDSILSKVDSNNIEDIVVINGPYSVRHGPGFSFIDIASRPTRRSDGSDSWHGRSAVTYNSNGNQWNANQRIEYGAENWGATLFYGHLLGDDYQAGNGMAVPSSYKSRNVNFAIGYDLWEQTTLEFRYLRQDQTDVDLPGQFTDIDYLATDGFSLSLKSQSLSWCDSFSIDGYFNQTRTQGSGGRPQKQALFNSVFDQLLQGRSTLPRGSESFSRLGSSGFSTVATWGDTDEVQFSAGTDLRHYRTHLNETQIRPDGTGGVRSGTEDVVAVIPKSESTDTGIFGELVIPLTEVWRVRSGVRVDWVNVEAGPGAITRRGGVGSARDVIGRDREEAYELWAAYVTSDYDLTENLTFNTGLGFAQRPPTLTELYAMRPFESVLQQGLNRIQGNPNLSPEYMRQIDFGLRLQEDNYRGGARGFYAWIDDYITMQGLAVDPSSSSQRLTSVYINTPLATLAGAELYGELDVVQRVSVFGSMMYVEGRNQSLNDRVFGTPSSPSPAGSSQGPFVGRNAFNQVRGDEPLPQVPPLETRLGVRCRDENPKPKWGSEITTRIVDDQDRVASGSLLEQPTPGFTTYDFRGFVSPTDNWTILFGVLNFTDKHYREHLDNRAGNQLFQPGISGYLGSEFNY